MDLNTQRTPPTPWYFSTLLSPIDSSSRQKNQQTLELSGSIDQTDLTDMYKVFHIVTSQYTFFSVAHGTFSKIDHIVFHKASLNKYKKIEIISYILSDHNAVRLELNSKINSRKYSNTWKLNKILHQDQWVIEK
jgi:exonuclease III